MEVDTELTDQRLAKLIDDLRQGKYNINVRKSSVKAEQDLFGALDLIAQAPEEKKKEALKNHGVVLETFPLETQLQRIEYKRVTTVFNRKIYNKFFVPIWAAAMSADRKIGYALYPKLTCVKDLIEGISKDKYDRAFRREVLNVLRHCIAPVALALDALHAPLPGKRMMYYHRELSIDNVYVFAMNGAYGDAMVKFTKMSRGSHTEYIDRSKSSGTPSSTALFGEYFYHQQLRGWPGARYHKTHDWFSFGIYVLEVMNMLLPWKDNFRNFSGGYYVFAFDYEEYLQGKKELEDIMPQLSQYLKLAKECMKLEKRKPMSRHADKSFEYDVSEWTAQLLGLYEESFTPPYNWPSATVPSGEFKPVCVACLLRKPGPIVSAVQTPEGLQCDSDCTAYCFSCYTNGERQFCSNQHGTVSTVLGHHSSYAMILYGTDDNADHAACFKRDAMMLKKTLTHKLICGIPGDHVLCKPVFDMNHKDKSAGKLLEERCQEMAKIIHGEDSNTCTNNARYTLFIFYSGHGHSEKKENRGNWCPTGKNESSSDVIPKAVVADNINLLKICSNTTKPACQADCVEVICVMDHCYPAADFLADGEPVPDSSGYVAAKPGTRSKGVYDEPSEIATWFSMLMRSCYFIKCSPKHQKCWDCIEGTSDCCQEVYCQVSTSTSVLDICTRIRRSIKETGDQFITGESLKRHQDHTKNKSLFETSVIVSIPSSDADLRLAYYNPDGVYLRVFNLWEDEDPVEIDFDCEMTCQRVAAAVLKELGVGNKTICLLSSHANDYSKYELVCNSTINHRLDSDVLYYSLISKPVKVTLEMKEDGKFKHEEVTLPLEDSALKSVMQLEQPGPKDSELPNIISYLVHQLKHLKFCTRRDADTPAADELRQPQDTEEVTDPGVAKDAVFRNFLEIVGDKSLGDLDLNELEEEIWAYVQEKATEYTSRSKKPFTVQANLDGPKLEWRKREFPRGEISAVASGSTGESSKKPKIRQPESDAGGAEDDTQLSGSASVDNVQDSIPVAPQQ